MEKDDVDEFADGVQKAEIQWRALGLGWPAV